MLSFLHHDGVENVRQFKAMIYFKLLVLKMINFIHHKGVDLWITRQKMLVLPLWSRMFPRHKGVENVRQFRALIYFELVLC